MKTLIAIVTCNGREDWAALQRETWVPLVQNADVRFFKGVNGNTHSIDDNYTVHLNCGDDYQSLPNKVQEIIRWAIKHDYDFMLKCDDDVLLKPQDILASDYYRYDFSGHECAPFEQVPWGFNYWLSKKAMKLMENKPLPNNNNDEAWVAHTMTANGILLHSDPRYSLHYGRNLGMVPYKRALRKPKLEPKSSSRYFSWCMHNHDVSKEVLFEEFKRIFHEEVKPSE